jgi:formate C-acetyltransferase
MDEQIVEIARTTFADTARVARLRRRVRTAMTQPAVGWQCPERIDDRYMSEPLPVRKARAIALKLAHMPVKLWEEQLFAGSMTLEAPRVHAERGFPEYTTEGEREAAAERGVTPHSVFGHIVPDYATMLRMGLGGIRAEAEVGRAQARTAEEVAFLDSVVVAIDGVIAFAGRLAAEGEAEARRLELRTGQEHEQRAEELYQMAGNLRQVPAGPARTFWQALQAVWLLHMIFHSTMNGNAMGRLDQYAWPYLQADQEAGRLDLARAAELTDCFCLKFNERAQTNEEMRPEARSSTGEKSRRGRHVASSQVRMRQEEVGDGTHWPGGIVDRDRVDATNHWLQNIVIGGVRPDGTDGTNPLTYLLLDSYRRNEMTNPLLTVRVHRGSPERLLARTSEVLKAGGGMPAIFNDEAIPAALERIGIPTADARDYTNDGCWEVIIPGRTDFRFQRLSVMLPLEWTFTRGRSRLDGELDGIDTGDPRAFMSYEELWDAYCAQLEASISRVVDRVIEGLNDRSTIAPVPLLSALIEGCIAARRDMTVGGSKFRTYGMLAESAAHAIDSLTAIKTVVFEQGEATMAELCDALDANFEGYETLRARLLAAPKYGNDDERADAVGQALIEDFTSIVARHAEGHRDQIRFPCGVGTFSWYVGIGEGLGASPDGRHAWAPVSSNFSPALGRDLAGIPGTILSYSKMHHCNLPAGGPLDLRLAKRLVEGEAGTGRMIGLIRGFVDKGGAMMTLTVADTEELRAAQRNPDRYESLRVRMGGWCAYFTMLSHEQQEHHIRRQEARS